MPTMTTERMQIADFNKSFDDYQKVPREFDPSAWGWPPRPYPHMEALQAEACKGLAVLAGEFRNLDFPDQSKIRVGDMCDFKIIVRNNAPVPFRNLRVYITPIPQPDNKSTVSFTPVSWYIGDLYPGQGRIHTISGKCEANPNDDGELDKAAHVSIDGTVDLSKLSFNEDNDVYHQFEDF